MVGLAHGPAGGHRTPAGADGAPHSIRCSLVRLPVSDCAAQSRSCSRSGSGSCPRWPSGSARCAPVPALARSPAPAAAAAAEPQPQRPASAARPGFSVSPAGGRPTVAAAAARPPPLLHNGRLLQLLGQAGDLDRLLLQGPPPRPQLLLQLLPLGGVFGLRPLQPGQLLLRLLFLQLQLLQGGLEAGNVLVRAGPLLGHPLIDPASGAATPVLAPSAC